MAINVALLRKIQAHILEEPKRINQGVWIASRGDERFGSNAFPACGTIGCVAGWACVLSGLVVDERFDDVHAQASHALGLSREQAIVLFDARPDGVQPRVAVGPRRHARQVARHIDRFIAKYAPEAKD